MATLSTSSFMSEILASTGHLEKDDLNAKLEELCKRTDSVKVDLFHTLQQENFQPNLATAQHLGQRVNETVSEMTVISNKIEKEMHNQLNVSTVEFQELSRELEESKAVMAVLESLVKIQVALRDVDTALTNKDVSASTQNLQLIQHTLQEADERCKDIHIFQVVEKRYEVLREQLVQDLHTTWADTIRWSLPSQAGKRARKYSTELSVARGDGVPLQDTLQAMHNLGVLRGKLANFAQLLLDHIVQPILTKGGLTVETKNSSGVISLHLVHTKDTQPPRISAAFTSLTTTLSTVHKALLEMTISDADGTSHTLMEVVGELIGEQFVNLIIEKCLEPAIPTSAKELEGFSKVLSDTETMDKFLKGLYFLPASENRLMDYTSNVNVHFANKKCEEVLRKAHSLMCSNLHQTVGISSDAPFGELPLLGGMAPSTSTEIKAPAAKQACLSASTFRLPTCQISLSVQQLCTLVYEMLHEATTSTPQCAVQLFFAVHNVFELFCAVVPTYHKETLVTLPQLSALHHNNCLYLAHHLLTLGHQFRDKLPQPLKQGMATFVDLVPKIRRLGTECFLQQMTRQKNQMVEYLASAQGFQNVTDTKNYEAAEKAVMQCLTQLGHIGSVWKDVLPENIYCKAMGTLVNCILVEVGTSVVALEDIQSTDTHGLCSLIAVILDKAPEFFNLDDGEANAARASAMKHVAKWNRLQELQILLDAKLVDITDRWADGKGPLALEFTANEVKQLIRALFQNSDRRATALSKIR